MQPPKELDAIVDRVLSHKPRAKTAPAKKRAKKAKKMAKTIAARLSSRMRSPLNAVS
jgi:hypothetical protein